MKKICFPFQCLFSLFLLAWLAQAPPALFADDGYYFGSGSDVYPLENTEIQLVSETIVITYDANQSRDGYRRHLVFLVEVDMTFKNQGPAASVQMGFPVYFTGDENEAPSEDNHEIDTQFRTWVNNQEVAMVRKKGIPNPRRPEWHFSDSVFTYTASFKAGEVKKIRHSYRVGGGGTNDGNWSFEYILRTGALWKGVIEDFSLLFKTKISALRSYYGFEPRERKIEVQKGDDIHFIWNFKNFEPKNDFKINGNYRREHHEMLADNMATSALANDLEWCSSQEYMRAKSMELRYKKNKILALYGYPFVNPFVKAQFYFPGSPFKENANFSYNQMAREHLSCVAALAKAEKEKLREEEKEFGIAGTESAAPAQEDH